MISTVPHKAWQAASFPILKALLPLVIIMFKERLDKGVIGGVPEGNRRDHNIVRVSSFASKELSWHERRCIAYVRCSLNRDSSLPFYRGYHLLIYPSSQNTSVTIL